MSAAPPLPTAGERYWLCPGHHKTGHPNLERCLGRGRLHRCRDTLGGNTATFLPLRLAPWGMVHQGSPLGIKYSPLTAAGGPLTCGSWQPSSGERPCACDGCRGEARWKAGFLIKPLG